MLLLGIGLTAVTAMTTRMQCLDAAREAALAGARGEPAAAAAARIAPEGAAVRIGGTGDSVTAEVSVRVRMLGTDLPGLVVRGRAIAAREPGEAALP